MRYVMTAALLCAAVPAAAQDAITVTKQAVERQEMVEGTMQGLRVAVESKQTKNAPYSAEAVTESVQVLADGNRIVTKSGTRVYRDSEGRTRREQLNAGATDVLSVNISDPIAGTSYVLDPVSHLAYRNGMITVFDRAPAGVGGAYSFTTSRAPEGAMVVTTDKGAKQAAEAGAVVQAKQLAEIRTRVAAEAVAAAGSDGPGGTVAFVSGAGGTYVTSGTLSRVVADGGKTSRQDLGQQTIEGVTATGTRTVTEIPAGTIGNEQPIKILSEQWFSPELQVLVMTKHSDPRSGEIIYRLTGIVRAEPARSLFDVPPDYTLHESRIRRQQER